MLAGLRAQAVSPANPLHEPPAPRGHVGAECRCHALAASVRTYTSGSVIPPRNSAKRRSRAGCDDHRAILDLDVSGQRDRLLHGCMLAGTGAARRAPTGVGVGCAASASASHFEASVAVSSTTVTPGPRSAGGCDAVRYVDGRDRGEDAGRHDAAGRVPQKTVEVARALLGWRYSVDRKTTRAPERRPLARARLRRA